jgi:hypothetical protein
LVNVVAYGVRTAGVGIVAYFILAIVSAAVSAAATKEEAERCRAIEQRAERLDCFKSLRSGAPRAKTESAAPAKTEDKAQAKPTSIEPGQPLCLDRTSLAAMILAGLLTSNPTDAETPGCQTLPDDAKLDVLERYPSVFSSIRIIRVKVTSPTHPDLTSGFTFETH